MSNRRLGQEQHQCGVGGVGRWPMISQSLDAI